MLAISAMLPGCIEPPNRNQQRDEEMARDSEMLRPEPRTPVDAARRQPEDPPPPELHHDVRRLSSDIKLERIQADNRLRQAGADGVMAAVDFLGRANEPAAALVETMNFLIRTEVDALKPEQVSALRAALAARLGHATPVVRATAARALQVIGPGAQRTTFLRAIADPERRVRWAVVRRFGEFADEVDRPQMLILLAFLAGGSETEFARLDRNNDGTLDRHEFLRGEDEFARLDRDRSGGIDRAEWLSPVDSAVRADVYTVLLRLHEKLTPDQRPIVYNPWAPAGHQQDAVTAWQRWVDALPRK